MDGTVVAAGNVRRRLLWFTLLATVFDGAELTLLSYFFPTLAHDFRVGIPAIVAVNTLQGLCSVAGGLLFGPVGDRIGRRITIAVTVFLYGAATLAGAFAHSLPAFTLSRAVAGVGIGGEFGAAFATFSEVWQGRARGLMGAMVQNMFVVGLVLTTVVGFAAVRAGGAEPWRPAYVVVGVATLLVCAAVLRWMPESPLWQAYNAARRAGQLPEALRSCGSPAAAFSGRLAGTTLLGMLVASGAFYANYSLVLFEPTVLLGHYHLAPAAETALLLAGFAALFAGSLLAGALSDRLGRRAGLAIVAAIGVAAFFACWRTAGQAYPGSPWVWAFGWSLLAANVGCGCIAVLGVWLGELYPTRLRATGENLVYYTGRGLGGSLLPLVAIAQLQAPGLALVLGGCGTAAAALAGVAVRETRGRQIAAVE